MTEKKIYPNIKKNVYKIENGNLKKMYIDEKKIESYYKKYIHYIYDDIIIFNFDYNLIKPYVVRLLQKKGFYDDYNKMTITIITVILFIFIGIFYIFNSGINQKIEGINKNFNSEILKNKNNLDFLKNQDEKIYYILKKTFTGDIDESNNYNPINGNNKK